MESRSSGSGDEDAAMVDAAFGALADVERRHALYYLRVEETTTLGELATVVTGWLRAREDGASAATPEDRRRTIVGLHHTHLPMLADAGFVRYDPDSGEVALADIPDFLDTALDRALAVERAASSDSRHNSRPRG
ncbi:DUF7344 domain-containing protein [Halorussus amylolyticus]|uniref:DUF7344 domain-containing protein n=1 Tax=Halorussus amylolyticus TaxID=1126242 RepID=UPI0010495AE6|nr:ArsR family transcriptional regulator [Halorussus amylolyticus]